MTNKIVLIILSVYFVSCSAYHEEHEYAEMVIEKVEKYRFDHGKLPSLVSDIGLTEKLDSPAFYSIESDSTYIVWYGIAGVGNSNVYHSDTKTWREEG